MGVSLSPEAIEDQDLIVEDYLARAPALALRFLDETQHLYERLEEHPRAYQVLYDDVRRALLESLPHAVFYVEDDGEVYILRVLHVRTNPAGWPG